MVQSVNCSDIYKHQTIDYSQFNNVVKPIDTAVSQKNNEQDCYIAPKKCKNCKVFGASAGALYGYLKFSKVDKAIDAVNSFVTLSKSFVSKCSKSIKLAVFLATTGAGLGLGAIVDAIINKNNNSQKTNLQK